MRPWLLTSSKSQIMSKGSQGRKWGCPPFLVHELHGGTEADWQGLSSAHQLEEYSTLAQGSLPISETKRLSGGSAHLQRITELSEWMSPIG